MTTIVDESSLDAYLLTPDCPQCGSEDVVCIDSQPDGFGGAMRTYRCERCGYVWTVNEAEGDK